MKGRCHNPRNKRFELYGARGIKVCERWRNSYLAFITDMGRRPTEGRWMIERVNNDADYCPENCIWSTVEVQLRNKRNNRYYEHDGKRLILADWAKFLGLPKAMLRTRLGLGWSFEQAISRPSGLRRNISIVTVRGKTLPFAQMARMYDIDPRTVRSRMRRGWDVERSFTEPKPAAA
jgi:hypothetical protein